MSLDRLKRLLGEEPAKMEAIKPFPTDTKMAKGGAAKQSVKETLRGVIDTLQERLARKPAEKKEAGTYAREAEVAPRAPTRSKKEIEEIADRISQQMQPGFVRVSPELSINPEGKSRALYELEQRTPMVTRSNLPPQAVSPIDIQNYEDAVAMAIFGDPTMGSVAKAGSLTQSPLGGVQLERVGDVALERPVQLFGGPRYGMDDKFWASQKGAAQRVLNRVDELAKQYDTENVLGLYSKMTPESSRYALHNLDAMLSVLQPERLPKDKLERLNKMVEDKFPQFPGFEDPANILLQAQVNPNMRKFVAGLLEGPKIAKELGFAVPGRVVQTAITHPELRNLEAGITGFSVGEMKPGSKLSRSAHPTYEMDIPGAVLGRMKYPVPYELAFPDFVNWYRTHPDVATKVDPINLMRNTAVKQVIDPQYIDEIKLYEEAMKRRLGYKKGGRVKSGLSVLKRA